MQITKRIIVFDAADLAAESGFWAAVLGGTVEAEPDWHTLYIEGRPELAFQLAPNHVRPEWPLGAQQQQLHLDLYVEDFPAAHQRVLALGATVLSQARSEPGGGFQVYADPAGHPFCLCRD